MRKAILTFAFGLFSLLAICQSPDRWTSSEIHEAMQKLNVLGSALYVAAHPDDENTQMISYLSNELQVNTAYLSLTRGDGGQNLIGPEIEDLLGVIRTQELLAARQIDGGKQFFTRANDFGFSKHPDETLEIWNKEEVLADVVWTIRNFQPDIVINRFDHESAGRTHGHHTSSAVLSYEAFDLAGDPGKYPEQLAYTNTWQPRRLFFNTSWWFYGSRENFDKADKSKMVSVDVGVFYPTKGKSNTEIAAESRSMHKCQGMGRSLSRGSQSEYLKLLKGDMPTSNEDLFAGIDITWNRVKNGAPIGNILAEVAANFDYQAPYKSLPALLQAWELVQKLEDGYWKRVKQAELKDVIKACLGLYVEATANDYSATVGDEVEVTLELVNRSPIEVELSSIILQPFEQDTLTKQKLENNQTFKYYRRFTVPASMEYTSPYWLNDPAELGMYTVTDQTLRGKPETPRAVKVQVNCVVAGVPITWSEEVVYKKVDPVAGETFRPFEILPPVFVNISEAVYVYPNQSAKPVEVQIRSGRAGVKGIVRLDLPAGWRSEPESLEVDLPKKDQKEAVTFMLYPPEEQEEATIRATFELDRKTYDRALTLIEYDHIPTQSVLQPSQAKVVKLDLQKAGNRVGYIMGAGDEIPASLEQIGYQVDLLEENDILPEQLKKYDAIILGIRAYNTVDRMEFYQPILLEYVEQGGTMIVQYNTTWRMEFPADEIAPYKLQLSRDRVSQEEAEIRFLAPEHPVLNKPNKITQTDFDGWVQERGLYFADEWGPEFTPILACNDPGESSKEGGLLVAKYGDGYYIYTGYSWFRELPAGVAGAYRLFTNLISLGKETTP